MTAAYISQASWRVSMSAGSSAGSSAAPTPAIAASMPRPVILTPPPDVQRSEPGTSLRCARPAACAAEMAWAASATSVAAQEGSSGPSLSMSVSDSPATHSMTM